MTTADYKASSAAIEDRWIALGSGAAQIPERLLRAHSLGQVLFITGAGTSVASKLPDFHGLVLDVYRKLDVAVATCLDEALEKKPPAASPQTPALSHQQSAEVERFLKRDYDVALGMLERRMDSVSSGSSVRNEVCRLLRTVNSGGVRSKPKPNAIHRSLARLAMRGDATTIVTTNFDRLLQAAMPRSSGRVPTRNLGDIPRPGRGSSFAGVLHIHGVLSEDAREASDVVVTDHDFGEFYLRRRVVPDFIYDAARLYHLVLVGYSANDAPMRYLLNAVAADGSRFGDLKERFTFVGMPAVRDGVQIEDWKGRGITPIPYDDLNYHAQLTSTLERWADLSAFNKGDEKLRSLFRQAVRRPWHATPDEERDLIDHIYRRSDANARLRLVELAADRGADADWLGLFTSIDMHPSSGPRS